MRNLLNNVKWAYQRVVRGYDDRIHWGFDTYFIQIIPALEEFCINETEDEEINKLNQKRTKVFKKTLKLIEEYKNADFFDCEDELSTPIP